MRWPFIAIGLLTLAAGCSTSRPAAERTGRPFEIVQTRFLGSLWNEALANASVVSQDGGQSFPAPGGAIWAFGDTFKGSRSADGTPHFAGGAVSCSIAFLGNDDKKYVMASSSDFGHPREIRLLVADAPYGPWSPPVARIQEPQYRQGRRVELVYCAFLHPELFREDGKVMNLTYSLALKDAGFDANCEMVEIEVKRSK